MKGLFFPILSLQYPERTFRSEAVLSAMPSIREIVVFEAQSERRNNGITL